MSTCVGPQRKTAGAAIEHNMILRDAFRSGWVAVVMLTSSLRGADWPQFLGPDRTGVSVEKGLLRAWPAGGPKEQWSVEVGAGFGGAAVRDGEVYVLDRVGERQDVLRCLDLKTGKALWTCAYDAPGKLPYDGSRSVPTVDERFVFTVGPFGHLQCIDRQSHRIVWSKHMVNDFKDAEIDRDEKPRTRAEKLARAQVPEWGVTQSVVLYKDLVIVAPQTEKVGLAGYEKGTGKLRWASGYVGRNWYSHVSPWLMRLGGADQVVMLAQPSDPEKSPASAPPAVITSIDPDTGGILWKAQTPRPYKIPIPQPLRIGEDRVFITGGYGLGCMVLKVAKEGGQWKAEVVFRKNTVASHIHSPVLYDGRIYVTSFREHGAANTGLVCVDENGELVWQTGPKLQFDFGGFIVADGLIFIMNGKTGELHLLEITSGGYKLLAKAKVLAGEGGTTWAPLALSEGRLIVRDQEQMKCLDVRTP